MRTVNRVTLLGNLGNDAELKHTPSGIAVCTFSVATQWRIKNRETGDWKEETDWHRIVYWRSDKVAPYLKKGQPVYIEGRLRTRQWGDKGGNTRYMTEVVVQTLVLLNRREGGGYEPADTDDPGDAQPQGGRPSNELAGRPSNELTGSEDTQAVADSEASKSDSYGATDDDVPF